jgi:hypothetical protein
MGKAEECLKLAELSDDPETKQWWLAEEDDHSFGVLAPSDLVLIPHRVMLHIHRAVS